MAFCVLSLAWLFAILWTVAHQTPLSIGFFRQEFWSGLPFPPPGDLPDSGTEPESPVSPALAGRFFTTKQLDVQPHYTDAKALAWIISDSYGAKSESIFSQESTFSLDLPGALDTPDHPLSWNSYVSYQKTLFSPDSFLFWTIPYSLFASSSFFGDPCS